MHQENYSLANFGNTLENMLSNHLVIGINSSETSLTYKKALKLAQSLTHEIQNGNNGNHNASGAACSGTTALAANQINKIGQGRSVVKMPSQCIQRCKTSSFWQNWTHQKGLSQQETYRS